LPGSNGQVAYNGSLALFLGGKEESMIDKTNYILMILRQKGFFIFQYIHFILLGFILLSASVAHGDIWYVTPYGSGSMIGTNWDNAFASIEAAIDAACPGDEIWVSEGTYALSARINVDKAVDVYGGFPDPNSVPEPLWTDRDWRNNVTTVDGQEMVRCFFITADATLDGFMITSGSSGGEWPGTASGAGIMIDSSSPTIANCEVFENWGCGGAGIAISNSLLSTIYNCKIANNECRYPGGDRGEGIYTFNSAVDIDGCTFFGHGNEERGAALFNDSSTVNITNSTFFNNFAERGGGAIRNESSICNITNCLFYENSGWRYGGGDISNKESTLDVKNSTFYKGRYSTEFSAIYSGPNSTATLTNCILWAGEIMDSGPNKEIDGYNFFIRLCDIDENGYEGIDGNIRQDPLFIDPDNGDFHLASESPCVNAGTSENAPDEDIDGDQRPQVAGYDIGADEFVFIEYRGNGGGGG